ncbi:radical SAM family heme chaperone HemW [uncultured Pelagimonas sp.]|uniref:radical SAM family heme chaperone HemW n=1 Tax=uncultured Pelagimonas sp. TaxID=1618102 RepID=UPI00262A9EEB|nr:radical SAM family heme chaperone HemW [uncultured Pelagimonas sp.]
MIEDWQSGGFGLYVHWPFCEAKCPYCDFNSHVVKHIDQTRWAKALASEVERVSALTPGRVLRSIFFGGGTPSLMLPQTVATILEATQTHWTWANDIEITLEANPNSVEADRFRGFADAGINRVSLGIQSLRDDDLRKLGRLHNADEAKRAFGIARDTFSRVSFDLIYARQNQTLSDWETELSEALAMAGDHLSLYQLTVEHGTAFWDRQNAGKLRGLPGEDLAADMYDLTQDICTAAGMPAYEVSNHAAPGSESRHNLIYWTYGDYAGVGPGAHGRLTISGQKFANSAWLQPGAWLNAVEAGSGDEVLTKLSGKDQASEYLMMGLRITEGVDIARIHNMYEFNGLDTTVDSLHELGLMWKSDDRIGVTQQGRLVLNSVIAELLPE